MIITRTPLRISLGGGGTDLRSFYGVAGPGFLVAAAISKHIYIAVNENFDNDLLLKYSSVERVDRLDAIQHPLLRECLRHTNVTGGVEITSMADIPAGTGLGSSGAFSVGVLRALYAHGHRSLSNEEIAQAACVIEMDRLQEPVGKQDQYIAAVGGLMAFEFHANEEVVVEPVPVSVEVRNRLEENLLLFYTGVKRPASEILAYDDTRARAGGGDLIDNLTEVRALGRHTCDVLVNGDLDAFGRLLTAQWELKFERSPTPMHADIDRVIRQGIERGAVGGKLVGAGGGGFLLFYAEEKASLRELMRGAGLSEVRFAFDNIGSTTLVAG